MQYVDGYVIPVPTKKLATYLRMAKLGCKVWCDNGAVDYHECVGDDLNLKFGIPFPRLVKAKPGETVVFSWIVFKSRAHRDRVNAKAMKDPRMAEFMDPKKMPFDSKRMSCGGFKVLVEA